MKPNLDNLRQEIARALAEQGFVVFHGAWRQNASRPVADWDTGAFPGYRDFLAVAREAGVKLIGFRHLEFSTAMIEDAMEQLEESEMPPDERQQIERRLRETRGYDGFTCALGLSFDLDGRTYMFDLYTDWYADFLSCLDDIDNYLPEDDEEEEDPMGGYYSRN